MNIGKYRCIWSKKLSIIETSHCERSAIHDSYLKWNRQNSDRFNVHQTGPIIYRSSCMVLLLRLNFRFSRCYEIAGLAFSDLVVDTLRDLT